MACQELKEQNPRLKVQPRVAEKKEEEGSGGVNEVYLFLLAITLGFGFALGGVLARAHRARRPLRVALRESRRRLAAEASTSTAS
jgi:uncharacterized protein HemX